MPLRIACLDMLSALAFSLRYYFGMSFYVFPKHYGCTRQIIISALQYSTEKIKGQITNIISCLTMDYNILGLVAYRNGKLRKYKYKCPDMSQKPKHKLNT